MSLVCGLEVCPCDKDPRCKRAGNCEECVANHKVHKTKPLPYCKRPENAERIEQLKNAQNR